MQIWSQNDDFFAGISTAHESRIIALERSVASWLLLLARPLTQWYQDHSISSPLELNGVMSNDELDLCQSNITTCILSVISYLDPWCSSFKVSGIAISVAPLAGCNVIWFTSCIVAVHLTCRSVNVILWDGLIPGSVVKLLHSDYSSFVLAIRHLGQFMFLAVPLRGDLRVQVDGSDKCWSPLPSLCCLLDPWRATLCVYGDCSLIWLCSGRAPGTRHIAWGPTGIERDRKSWR